jgi:hypothetical protein
MRYLVVYESFKTEDYYVEIEPVLAKEQNYIEMDDKMSGMIMKLLKPYSLYIEDFEVDESGDKFSWLTANEDYEKGTHVIRSIGPNQIYFKGKRLMGMSIEVGEGIFIRRYEIYSLDDDYFIVELDDTQRHTLALYNRGIKFYKCDHFEGLVKFLEDEDIIPKQ